MADRLPARLADEPALGVYRFSWTSADGSRMEVQWGEGMANPLMFRRDVAREITQPERFGWKTPVTTADFKRFAQAAADEFEAGYDNGELGELQAAGQPGRAAANPETFVSDEGSSAALGELYHSTPYADGFPYDEWMHVGTRDAALQRARSIHPDHYGLPGDTPVYLYTVRLRGRVYPRMLTDEQATIMTGDAYPIRDVDSGMPPGLGYKIFPYINDAEDKGSTSYLAHRSAIVPVRRETFPRNELPGNAAAPSPGAFPEDTSAEASLAAQRPGGPDWQAGLSGGPSNDVPGYVAAGAHSARTAFADAAGPGVPGAELAGHGQMLAGPSELAGATHPQPGMSADELRAVARRQLAAGDPHWVNTVHQGNDLDGKPEWRRAADENATRARADGEANSRADPSPYRQGPGAGEVRKDVNWKHPGTARYVQAARDAAARRNFAGAIKHLERADSLEAHEGAAAGTGGRNNIAATIQLLKNRTAVGDDFAGVAASAEDASRPSDAVPHNIGDPAAGRPVDFPADVQPGPPARSPATPGPAARVNLQAATRLESGRPL